ncbi:hypothetical protein FHS56_002245 [Thermonema lapsum]|uniref:Uncharacterized protein n=1 Tax=Thermonema lapsum TaxID=28195 RepID=A0A846MT20_9BACT|nr:hypothetical protein [Thermonema lapsum]NIK74713.1 hypothetical protein [Thermonema lapsum]
MSWRKVSITVLLILAIWLSYYFLWVYPQRYRYSTEKSIPYQEEMLFYFPTTALLLNYIENSPYAHHILNSQTPEKAWTLLRLLLQSDTGRTAWLIVDFQNPSQSKGVLCIPLRGKERTDILPKLESLFASDFISEKYQLERRSLLRLQERSSKRYISFCVEKDYLLISFTADYMEYTLRYNYWQHLERLQRIFHPESHTKAISVFFRFHLIERFQRGIRHLFHKPPAANTLIYAQLTPSNEGWWLSGNFLTPSYAVHDLNRWRHVSPATFRQAHLIPDFLSNIYKISTIPGYGNPAAIPNAPPLPWIGDEMSYFTDSLQKSRSIAFLTVQNQGTLEEHCRRMKHEPFLHDVVFAIRDSMRAILQAHLPRQFPDLSIYWGVLLDEGRSLLVSPSANLIEEAIHYYRQERTWGKNVQIMQYLRSLPSEQDICFIQLPDAPYQSLMTQLPLPSLRGLELNMTPSESKIFIQLGQALSASSATDTLDSSTRSPQIQQAWAVELDEGNLVSVQRVTNHTSKTKDILLTTDLHEAILLSNEGKLRWKKSLPSTAVTPAIEVDYFNNGKYQYLIGCEQHLALYDRLGHPIKGYPLPLPLQSQLAQLSVASYDGSNNYRWVVGNTRGEILLLDKEGKLLQGWNPKRTGGHLIQAVQHFQHKSKDYFIVLLREKGCLLLNRRGETYPGFPVALPEPPVAYQVDAQQGLIYIIGEKGLLCVLNTEGKMINKVQLPRKEGSIFKIISNEFGFWIVKQHLNELSIYSPEGKLLWEQRFSATDDMDVQAIRHRNRDYFLVVEPSIAIAYLLDHQGNFIVNNIEKVQAACGLSSGEMIDIVATYGNTAKLIHISLN